MQKSFELSPEHLCLLEHLWRPQLKQKKSGLVNGFFFFSVTFFSGSGVDLAAATGGAVLVEFTPVS